MWVPLVENGEYDSLGADYFIQESLAKLFVQDAAIDTVILGCTHYPLLINKIRQFLPAGVCLVSQGEIVAHSLVDYLRRHPEIDEKCSKSRTRSFLTTDNTDIFDQHAAVFFGERVSSTQVCVTPRIVG
jgi:glutamate racemase